MIPFPYTAVVGQDQVKTALVLLAIDPRIGGICISGPRGGAKSTLARSLAELMPKGAEHFVTLPLGASEEMVIGTLDLQQVLKKQEVNLKPGLVQQAHEGVLYVDEVNLLADNLVDVLLDVTASGINTVERDGISHQHEARFVLIGTMNPDEGELRPQLLDRFALSVNLQSDYSTKERVEIVKRREAFEMNPQVFCAEYTDAQSQLAKKITTAQKRLDQVSCDDALRELISERCVQANVDGLRADIVWARAAKTHAAWQGRENVIEADVDAVEELVLNHRRQARPPQSGSSDSNQKPDSNNKQESPFFRPEESKGNEADEADGDWGSMKPQQQQTAANQYLDPDILSEAILTQFNGMSALQPRSKETLKPNWFSSLLDNKGRWPLEKIRFKKQSEKSIQLHYIMLDTSASTLGQQLFSQAKGVVSGIIEQAYLARHQIALIGFGNQQVTTLLKKGRAPKNSAALLEEITAGGGTPLREVLLSAQASCKKMLKTEPALQFIHYLITDGRSSQNIQDINLQGQCLLIDTESSDVKRGRGVELAQSLDARHIPISSLLSSS